MITSVRHCKSEFLLSVYPSVLHDILDTDEVLWRRESEHLIMSVETFEIWLMMLSTRISSVGDIKFYSNQDQNGKRHKSFTNVSFSFIISFPCLIVYSVCIALFDLNIPVRHVLRQKHVWRIKTQLWITICVWSFFFSCQFPRWRQWLRTLHNEFHRTLYRLCVNYLI